MTDLTPEDLAEGRRFRDAAASPSASLRDHENWEQWRRRLGTALLKAAERTQNAEAERNDALRVLSKIAIARCAQNRERVIELLDRISAWDRAHRAGNGAPTEEAVERAWRSLVDDV